MNGTEAAINFIISIGITAGLYLIAPVILKMTVFRKKHYSKKVYRNIAIANSVLCWVICRAITLSVYPVNVPVTYGAAFVWGVVAYKILCKGETFTDTPAVPDDAQITAEAPSVSEDIQGTDDVPERAAGSQTVENIPAAEELHDNHPYKIISAVLGVVCAVMLAAMIFMSVSHNNEMTEKQAKIRTLKESEEDMRDSVSTLNAYKQEVLDFYLDNAVLVVENGKYYHRAECPRLGNEYEYWIYNSEAAISEGYSKCPFCFSKDKEEYAEEYFAVDLWDLFQ